MSAFCSSLLFLVFGMFLGWHFKLCDKKKALLLKQMGWLAHFSELRRDCHKWHGQKRFDHCFYRPPDFYLKRVEISRFKVRKGCERAARAQLLGWLAHFSELRRDCHNWIGQKRFDHCFYLGSPLQICRSSYTYKRACRICTTSPLNL